MNKVGGKTAIILGTSRSDGNTSALAEAVQQQMNAELFSLAEYKIEPFCYNNSYQDDFAELMDTLLQFEQIIFATPMYWYSPSGQMKLFIDRLSDLLSFDKDKGRKLRTRTTALLATGNDKKPAACFEQMFQLTFHHLGMNYQGMSYCSCPRGFQLAEHEANLQKLVSRLTG